MNKISEIQKLLISNPNELKSNSGYIAKKYGFDINDVIAARTLLKESKKKTKLDEYIESNGIDKSSIKKVKYWQNFKGEQRFSVDVRSDENKLKIEDIRDVLLKDIEQVILPIIESDGNKTLIVYTSDKHIGAHVPDNALFENEYNKDVFASRMRYILMEINKQVRINGVFKKIVVIDLGDGLDGMDQLTTRKNHKLPQNMNNVEAFNTFIEVHKWFYGTLLMSENAESYEFHHVVMSNHSSDFDYFANACVKEYLNAKYDFKSYNIHKMFINTISVCGMNFMLSHGKDDLDMKHGFPLTLNDKTESYIKDYMIEYGLDFGKSHFIKGDLHQASTQHGKMFRYRNIPSIFGSSKWVMTNFGNSKPGCSFDLISDGNIYEWNLWFK